MNRTPGFATVLNFKFGVLVTAELQPGRAVSLFGGI